MKKYFIHIPKNGSTAISQIFKDEFIKSDEVYKIESKYIKLCKYKSDRCSISI